jgi:hypothetical protein
MSFYTSSCQIGDNRYKFFGINLVKCILPYDSGKASGEGDDNLIYMIISQVHI